MGALFGDRELITAVVVIGLVDRLDRVVKDVHPGERDAHDDDVPHPGIPAKVVDSPPEGLESWAGADHILFAFWSANYRRRVSRSARRVPSG
jgi:hypothetical protein